MLLSSARAAAPPLSLLTVIRGVIAAANANNAPKVGSYFEPESFVVDEFPPYVWKGADAGGRWWSDVARDDATHGRTLHASIGPISVSDVSVSDAYVVVPLTITSEARGKQHRETGLWALTFHRTRVIWRISSASWATESSSP